MDRTARLGRVGGLAASAVAATPFVCLWVLMMLGSEESVTLRRGLDMALVTGAALPAGRVLALWFVGLLGGLATLTVARSRRVGGGWPGLAVTGVALVGVAACLAATGYYLAEYPSYPRTRGRGIALSLPPVTAVALALALAGGVWLALRPSRWDGRSARGRGPAPGPSRWPRRC
jgi:hypothetical protein